MLIIPFDGRLDAITGVSPDPDFARDGSATVSPVAATSRNPIVGMAA